MPEPWADSVSPRGCQALLAPGHPEADLARAGPADSCEDLAELHTSAKASLSPYFTGTGRDA